MDYGAAGRYIGDVGYDRNIYQAIKEANIFSLCDGKQFCVYFSMKAEVLWGRGGSAAALLFGIL